MVPNLRVKFACLLCVVALLGACATPPLYRIEAPEPGSDVTELRRFGDELLYTAHAINPPSAFSAIIVDEAGTRWAGSVGEMSGTQSLAVTQDTPMHLGSITKLFTAFAIMQLQEQGKLDLDAKLTTYLPEFTIRSRFGDDGFTIRQMLTHYSGLPSDLYLDDFANPDDTLSTRAIFDDILERTAQTNLKSEPDFAHSYSNLAYGLLGHVIQRVSGERYDDYIRQNILLPLNMHDTAVLVQDAGGAWPVLAEVGAPPDFGYSLFTALSAGAMVSSAHDMGLFLQMLLAEGRGVVSVATFREMLTVQGENAILGGGTQGLGFQLASTPYASAGHGGALPGHFAFLSFVPEQKLGVVVMSGGDEVNRTGVLGNRLFEALLPPAPDIAADTEQPARVRLSAADAELYAGNYFAPGIGVIDIDNDDGKLTLRFPRSRLAKIALRPLGNDQFEPGFRVLGFIPIPSELFVGGVDPDTIRLSFHTHKDKRYITLDSGEANSQALAASIAEREIPRSWLESLGDYEPTLPNQPVIPGISLERNENAGFLDATVQTEAGGNMNLVLEILSDTEAAVAGVGRYTGELVELLPEDQLQVGVERFKRVKMAPTP